MVAHIYAKISLNMLNPRDLAGKAEEEEVGNSWAGRIYVG